MRTRQPSDFIKGEVYQMAVANESHITKPYYILIDDVGKIFIKITIPEKGSLKIYEDTLAWDYHTPRMTFIGADNISKQLIYNQK